MMGEYDVLTDDKFRISLPAELKDELLGTKRVITRSLDSNALQIITKEKFENIKKSLLGRKGADFDKHVLYFQRKFIAPAVDIELDKNLRIMIPRGLRTNGSQILINPKRPIKILAMDDKLEIWDAREYEMYMNNCDANEALQSCLDSFQSIGEMG